VRVILQRVSHASVRVDDKIVGEIGPGWLVLLGIGRGDDASAAGRLAQRVAAFRAFDDGQGRMNRSVLDVGGAALVVPNFTLYADTASGRRPSFTQAMPPAEALPLVESFTTALRAAGVPVATGEFGAHMIVDLTNDGPVTFILSTE
jgi:D-aminoacyl-tRNA deacylase